MIIQQKVQKIIKRLSLKYNLPEEEIRRIVFSPFELVKKSMKDAEPNNIESFKNIRIINFGLFAVKPGRIKHLKKQNDDRNNKTDQVTD